MHYLTEEICIILNVTHQCEYVAMAIVLTSSTKRQSCKRHKTH